MSERLIYLAGEDTLGVALDLTDEEYAVVKRVVEALTNAPNAGTYVPIIECADTGENHVGWALAAGREHVHYMLVGERKGTPGTFVTYHQTRDQLHSDVADLRLEGGTVRRLRAERVPGAREGCLCNVEETSAFAEGYSVGYYGTEPTWYENPWQQAEYDRGLTVGRARAEAEDAASL
jgi:hypothetical protein